MEAQIKSLTERNTHLEGRLHLMEEMHKNEIKDIQAKAEKFKEDRERLMQEIKEIKAKKNTTGLDSQAGTLMVEQASTSESSVLKSLNVIQGVYFV